MNTLEPLKQILSIKISELTHGFHSRQTEVASAGHADDAVLDFGDGASCVETWREQLYHACALFLDGQTFPTCGLSFLWCSDEMDVRVLNIPPSTASAAKGCLSKLSRFLFPEEKNILSLRPC